MYKKKNHQACEWGKMLAINKPAVSSPSSFPPCSLKISKAVDAMVKVFPPVSDNTPKDAHHAYLALSNHLLLLPETLVSSGASLSSWSSPGCQATTRSVPRLGAFYRPCLPHEAHYQLSLRCCQGSETADCQCWAGEERRTLRHIIIIASFPGEGWEWSYYMMLMYVVVVLW